MRQVMLIALLALLTVLFLQAQPPSFAQTTPDFEATITALNSENDSLRATIAALSPAENEPRFVDSFDDNSTQWALLPDVRIHDGWLIAGDRAETVMIPVGQLAEFYADFALQYDASARPYLCFGGDDCEYRILVTTIPTGLVDEPSMQIRLYHQGHVERESDPIEALDANALYHLGILYTGRQVEISIDGEPVMFHGISETSESVRIGLGSFLGQITVGEIRLYDARPAQ